VEITAVDAQIARGNNHVELGVVLTLQQRHHLTQTGVTAGQYRFQGRHRGFSSKSGRTQTRAERRDAH
jgi:hypothetical protein